MTPWKFLLRLSFLLITLNACTRTSTGLKLREANEYSGYAVESAVSCFQSGQAKLERASPTGAVGVGQRVVWRVSLPTGEGCDGSFELSRPNAPSVNFQREAFFEKTYQAAGPVTEVVRVRHLNLVDGPAYSDVYAEILVGQAAVVSPPQPPPLQCQAAATPTEINVPADPAGIPPEVPVVTFQITVNRAAVVVAMGS